MGPMTVSMVVKEKITANRVWLQALTEPQLRALACQHGIQKWAILSPRTLITNLAQKLDIQEPVRM